MKRLVLWGLLLLLILPPVAQAGEPALVWKMADSDEVLFTSDDIVKFDWERQIFELDIDKNIDLNQFIHRWFEVHDSDNVLYKGVLLGRGHFICSGNCRESNIHITGFPLGIDCPSGEFGFYRIGKPAAVSVVKRRDELEKDETDAGAIDHLPCFVDEKSEEVITDHRIKTVLDQSGKLKSISDEYVNCRIAQMTVDSVIRPVKQSLFWLFEPE